MTVPTFVFGTCHDDGDDYHYVKTTDYGYYDCSDCFIWHERYDNRDDYRYVKTASYAYYDRPDCYKIGPRVMMTVNAVVTSS